MSYQTEAFYFVPAEVTAGVQAGMSTLRAWRIHRNKSTCAMALRLGMSELEYMALEKTGADVRMHHLRAAAAVFNTAPANLM